MNLVNLFWGAVISCCYKITTFLQVPPSKLATCYLWCFCFHQWFTDSDASRDFGQRASSQYTWGSRSCPPGSKRATFWAWETGRSHRYGHFIFYILSSHFILESVLRKWTANKNTFLHRVMQDISQKSIRTGKMSAKSDPICSHSCDRRGISGRNCRWRR